LVLEGDAPGVERVGALDDQSQRRDVGRLARLGRPESRSGGHEQADEGEAREKAASFHARHGEAES
jgi:hypothetical protein